MRYQVKDIIQFFRNFRDERTKRKVSIFAICLFISCFIWLVVNLSKKYESDVYYPVVYSGIPGDEAYIEYADTVLVLKIKASGFRFLYMKYFQVQPPLNINLQHSLFKKSGKQNFYYLPTSSIGNEINSQLNNNAFLLGISPDTLLLKLKEVQSKKVPVKLSYTFNIAGQYKPYGTINLTPDSVIISGKSGFVDTIEFASTENLTVTDPEITSYKTSINKDLINRSLYLSDNLIGAEINIERFTEEEMSIPIEIINKPDSLDVNLFPDEMNIRYLVAMKDYDKINPKGFNAQVDFNEISEDRNFIKVRLEEYPDKVEITRTTPEKVEFILIRND